MRNLVLAILITISLMSSCFASEVTWVDITAIKNTFYNYPESPRMTGFLSAGLRWDPENGRLALGVGGILTW